MPSHITPSSKPCDFCPPDFAEAECGGYHYRTPPTRYVWRSLRFAGHSGSDDFELGGPWYACAACAPDVDRRLWEKIRARTGNRKLRELLTLAEMYGVLDSWQKVERQSFAAWGEQ